MIISEEKQKEFERAAKPLIRFLRRNSHPHVAAYVDSCSAELLEGICVVKTETLIEEGLTGGEIDAGLNRIKMHIRRGGEIFSALQDEIFVLWKRLWDKEIELDKCQERAEKAESDLAALRKAIEDQIKEFFNV